MYICHSTRSNSKTYFLHNKSFDITLQRPHNYYTKNQCILMW